eukprot:269254-Rhodomonas_salina.1
MVQRSGVEFLLENELPPSAFFFVGRAVDADGPAPTLTRLKACQGESTPWSRNSERCSAGQSSLKQ